MKRLHEQGFSAIEAIIIVVVLVGIGAAGYEFMKMHNKSTVAPTTAAVSSNTNSTPSTQTASVSVPSAPQVKSSQGLDNALNTLNQTNLDAGSTDSSQLGSQSSGF